MHSTIEIDDAASSRMTGSAVRRAAVACAALFLASALVLTITPAQSSSGGLPKIVDSLPRFGADAAAAFGVADLREATDTNVDNGLALIYPKLDRLYQLYNFDSGPHAMGLGLVERDLGTFKITRTKVIPHRWAEVANGPSGAEWVTTFDHNNDRLYIHYAALGEDLDPNQALLGLIGLSLRDFTHTDAGFPNFTAGAGDVALVLAGIEFDESTDTLLVVQAALHGVPSLGNALLLAGWKSDELLRGGSLPQVTPRPIRGCRRDPLNDASSPFLTPILVAAAPDPEAGGQKKTYVHIPCYSTTFSSNVVIARMDRQSALDPHSGDEKAIVAPVGVANWSIDTNHGRLFLLNNASEADAWVYEAASNAFVGIVAMSPKGALEAGSMALGVDEGSGRLYARGNGYGLMIVAAAQDPVPQADAYPHLAASGVFRLLVDPKRNRLLSLKGTSQGIDGVVDDYEVIAFPPPLPPQPKEDPDSRTAQVDEQPGKTVAQYGGNASAYGLRVLLARGVGGAVPSNGNNDAGDLYKNVNSYCGFTDRELVLARVSKTEFSNNSKFARAAAMDVDNATVVDLGSPSRCDIYNSYDDEAPLALSDVVSPLMTTGVLGELDRRQVPASKTANDTLSPKTTWDYTAADCARPRGEDEAGPNTSPLVGETSVDCRDDKGISAKAESRSKPLELDITVSKATSSTKVYLDKAKGLVSVSKSRLEGIKIGDISIGYIENSATAFAKGRKGTAGTEFAKPKIGYVAGPNVPSCDSRCDVDQVIKSLNTALAGRVEFRRITPESRLASGTPGGYEAGILKSEKQQASDNSLTGDKSVEIPALEMVVYNDNAKIGRARQVYQFAGVRADSHYGIQLAGAGTPGGPIVPDIGDVIDGVTGNIDPGIELPNDGQPLKVRNPGGSEGVLRRTIRQTANYADYSLRIIFNNPREAMVMATVWVLIWGPFVASRRRRALKAVTAATPEGPPLS